ncbi:MAG: hypothetical protein K6U80_20470, partial [Firmicutes bacterium]|nr:hypothetical protein [Bacillota bacterium]
MTLPACRDTVTANNPADQPGKPKLKRKRKSRLLCLSHRGQSFVAHRPTTANPAAVCRGNPLLPAAIFPFESSLSRKGNIAALTVGLSFAQAGAAIPSEADSKMP